MGDSTGGGPDWREQRRQEKQARREQRREMTWGPGGSWIAGLILVGLGIMFLLRNFGVPIPQNIDTGVLVVNKDNVDPVLAALKK